MKIITKSSDMKEILMEYILGALPTDCVRVMAHLNGTMDKFFKVIGKREWKMDKVFGNLPKVIFMKDNGKIIDSMDLVISNISWAHTKDLFKIS